MKQSLRVGCLVLAFRFCAKSLEAIILTTVLFATCCYGQIGGFSYAGQVLGTMGTEWSSSRLSSVPVGSETATVASDMFGDLASAIPNLEIGFTYTFGSNLRQSRWHVDYVLPFKLSHANVFFGEFHADSQNTSATSWFPFLNNFWQQGDPGLQNRIDLSFGTGYRTIFSDSLLVGANAFYDSTRLNGTWRSAGSFGFEAAAIGPGDSLLDVNFNFYSSSYIAYDSRGSNLPTFNLFGAISRGTGNFDVEAGYSQPLFERALDLRIKINAYQFELANSRETGLKTGGEITTGDGVMRLSMEYGHDGVIGSYGTVVASVNMGFQLDNILRAENPFTVPEPVFRSPRNLRRLLAQKVRRNWHKPSAVLANSECTGLPDDSQFQTPVDNACFWSGKNTMAECIVRGYTVQTQTPGGAWVDSYINSFPNSHTSTDDEYTRDFEPMWICASFASAKMAKGTVRVFLNNARSASVFYTTELPTLCSNQNVPEILAYYWNGATWVGPTNLK